MPRFSLSPSLANSKSGWRAWQDQDAFVDWFLHTEITKVAKKSYHSAAFMHKKSPGGPWVMGPVWAQLQGINTSCGCNFVRQTDGINGPGESGGSGISPNGWLFSICAEKTTKRCSALEGYDPGNGLANWVRDLWERKRGGEKERRAGRGAAAVPRSGLRRPRSRARYCFSLSLSLIRPP